jgi:fructokinase
MRIGIDLGGTKIELLALAPDRRERVRLRMTTPQGDYEGTLKAIAALVDEAERRVGEQGSVGIGTPGSQSPATGLMRNANSTCLNGRTLQVDLERVLGRKVRLANDANCFALAEALEGAGAGAEVVFGVILGTGVGGGLVMRGEVLEGVNRIAGEWGHNRLPDREPWDEPLPECYCGHRGCVETYLSGPGLRADHIRSTGVDLAPETIAAAASRGDEACRATLARYVDRLARSLAVVIDIVDPEVIVLGGGLSNIAALYEEVPRRWDHHIFSDNPVRTKLVRNRLGDSSGVRGAAWLWGGPPRS